MATRVERRHRMTLQHEGWAHGHLRPLDDTALALVLAGDDFDGPVAYSNVMLVCNRCDKTTRIAHGVNELGKRVIVCKKCGENYERAQV
jgi:hypothetical protein